MMPFLKMGRKKNAQFTSPLVAGAGGSSPAGSMEKMSGFSLLKGRFITPQERHAITGSRQQQEDMYSQMSGEGASLTARDAALGPAGAFMKESVKAAAIADMNRKQQLDALREIVGAVEGLSSAVSDGLFR